MRSPSSASPSPTSASCAARRYRRGCIQRFGAIHTFLKNRWYFDEAYDALIYRPLVATGRFANDVFERVVVQGIVNGTTGVVRGAGALVRGAQSGFVRAYALLLVGGFAALGLYFLIVSH